MTGIKERGQWLFDQLNNCHPATKFPEDLAQGAAAWLLYNWSKIEVRE